MPLAIPAPLLGIVRNSVIVHSGRSKGNLLNVPVMFKYGSILLSGVLRLDDAYFNLL